MGEYNTVTSTSFFSYLCRRDSSGAATQGAEYFIAIGRQLQWGEADGSGTASFPISFSSVCYGVVQSIVKVVESMYQYTVSTFDKTGFAYHRYSGNYGAHFTWIALGKQSGAQWGRTSTEYSATNVSYPIKYSSVFVGMIMVIGSGTDTQNYYIIDLGNTSMKIWVATVGVYLWFTIGVQLRQWGRTSSLVNHDANANIIFPINFPSAVYTAAFTMVGSNTFTQNYYLKDLTTTNMSIWVTTPGVHLWFAIGK